MECQKTFKFLKNIDETRTTAIRVSDMNPSWVKLTTITITSKFNTPVDTQGVREIFNNKGCVAVKSSQSKHVTYWKMSPTTFYNQVSIYYDDHKSRKSVKIFPNGSIQAAGCSDLPECNRVMKQIRCILAYLTKRKVMYNGFDIAMINTNFSLNFSVNLYEIFNIFNNAQYDTTYNPDRYAAVKVRVKALGDKYITVSIFGSGRVIMTGARSLEEISLTYSKIMKMFCENKYCIFDEASENVELFDMYRGVPILQWLEKISAITIKNNV